MQDPNDQSVGRCPHREPTTPDNQTAVCRLLEQILQSDSHLATVSYDACLACCASFPPTREDLNPVVASLLHGITSDLLGHSGPMDAEADRLKQLHEWAEQSLPIVLPDEDETGPSIPQHIVPETTITIEDIAAVLPPPQTTHGPAVSTWAVGVTTAPRRRPTLDKCLASLNASGWNRPRLFIDGEVTIPDEYRHLPSTHRNPSVGAWPNYYRTLSELLETEPAADAYMIVQDDVLFPAYSNTRAYVDGVLWPGTAPGLVSLYCCADYTAPEPGWSPWGDTWQYGALAFVFTRELATSFLADDQVRNHENRSAGKRKAGIDTVIGDWARRYGVPVVRPTPSLVQHIGHVSAIWETSRAVGLRRAGTFLGTHLQSEET